MFSWLLEYFLNYSVKNLIVIITMVVQSLFTISSSFCFPISFILSGKVEVISLKNLSTVNVFRNFLPLRQIIYRSLPRLPQGQVYSTSVSTFVSSSSQFLDQFLVWEVGQVFYPTIPMSVSPCNEISSSKPDAVLVYGLTPSTQNK